MFVAVIQHAPNCPVHDGKDYYGLQWFEREQDIIEWLLLNTRQGFFISEIWDDKTKARSPLSVTYEHSCHNIIEARLHKNGAIIALLSKHPYSDEKEWVIVKQNEEEDNIETPCEFMVSWVGQCSQLGENGRCSKHALLRCIICGAQATHDCEETFGGLVCGFSLCNDPMCAAEHQRQTHVTK